MGDTKSGDTPLKNDGNVVSSNSSKLQGPNGSDKCSEESVEKTAELHNGGKQITSVGGVSDLKLSKYVNENAKSVDPQDSEHASNSNEKWQLRFDLSDSASTSDNDGSEVEAADNVVTGLKGRDESDMEDSKDFQGFEANSTLQSYGNVLTKFIGLAESELKFVQADSGASTSRGNFDQQATSAVDGTRKAFTSHILPNVDNFSDEEMDIDDYEGVTFSLISNADVLRPTEERDKDSSSRNTDIDMVENERKASKKMDIESNTKEDNDKITSRDEKESEQREKKRKKVKEKEDIVLESDAKEKEDIAQESDAILSKVSNAMDSTRDISKQINEVLDSTGDISKQINEVLDSTEDISKQVNEVSGSTRDISKQINEVSMETSDIPNETAKGSSASGLGTTTEEILSEVTSSATSSPSASSRSSLKTTALGSSSVGKLNRGDSPALSASGGRGKKSSIDMSNPAFLKPFDYGWKRELVFRNTNETSMKKMADTYYYTPSGKKVRSNREVLEHLQGGELTIENFSFCKEPLGLNDTSKEIIRDAKRVAAKDPSITPVKKTPKPKLAAKPSPPLAETPSSSPQAESSTSPQVARSVPPKTFPKIKVSSVRLQKLPNDKGNVVKQKKNESSGSGEVELGTAPPLWSPSDTSVVKKTSVNSQTVTTSTWSSKTSTTTKKPDSEPCSIRCVDVMGIIPSLQCRLCLCLFHPECVGLGTLTETIHSYVCKNCQQEVKEGKNPVRKLPTVAMKLLNSSPKVATSTTPPPLTPISALGTGNKGSPNETTLGQSAVSPSSPPKLQRLPRMGDSGKLITVPRFVKVPKSRESILIPQQGLKGTGNKGTIVGSVTTWLPPSSTIQLTPSGSTKTSSSSASTSLTSSVTTSGSVSESSPTTPNSTNIQAIARMGNKKYIVVPKHNVLSVSPAMAATATTPTSKSSVQVGDSSPLGDKAPVTLSSNLVLTNTAGRTSTVLGGTQALIGQPQVLMPSSASSTGEQTISLVQSAASLSNFVTSGGPILPKPSAYIVSSGGAGGLQNPPGVLLVPFMGSGSPFVPTPTGQDTSTNKNPPQPQYLIVNGPSGSFQSGNFIISNLQQPVKPADAPTKPGDSEDSTVDGQAREGTADVNKGKRKQTGREAEGPAAKRLKSSTPTRPSPPTQAPSLDSERQFMQYFMMNMCAGYSALLHVFQYLKVQELLRAARVCRMWRYLAGHPSLWRTVRMKNSQVVDWVGLVNSLRRHETQHLDLRKMLVPSEDTHAMWDEFCNSISRATSLCRLDLCRCPAKVVEKVAKSCPQLKIINALAIKCPDIDFQSLANQKNLQELRLKSLTGIRLTTMLAPLKHLSNLKHLSLTTFKELGKMDLRILGSLKNLESLELGECCDFPQEFGPESLSRLKKLERLRLEKGQGKDCPTFSILAGIATLPKLTHLELVNFDVKPGFDKALAQCTNIRTLLIIPTYITQSATTNHMVLNGVNQLSNSLTHFVWGVTHELLRVTELFVDQCEGQKDKPSGKSGKKSSGSDSIPILKPIQLTAQAKNSHETKKLSNQENAVGNTKNGNTEIADSSEEREVDQYEVDDTKASAASAAPQVEILPLPKLQKLLTSSLPKTKVKILKIPFHATWRQTISEPAP